MNNWSEDLKKVLLAGIGAVAVTAEKSKEVVEDLVKKGELTVEQGKVLNEELKHNVAEKLRKPVSVETVEKDLQNMDVEDLETLKAKIEELQKAKNETNEEFKYKTTSCTNSDNTEKTSFSKGH